MEIPKNIKGMRRAFCEQMLVCDFNGSEAVRRAGYKTKTPDKEANRLMQMPEIKAYIEALKEERSRETGIDANHVLLKAADLLEKCLGNRLIKKVVVVNGKPQTIDVNEFNAAGAGKALELLGKHVTIGAFKDKVEHSGSISHEEMLDQLK